MTAGTTSADRKPERRKSRLTTMASAKGRKPTIGDIKTKMATSVKKTAAKAVKSAPGGKGASKKPTAGERIWLVLVDNRDEEIVNKAAYYAAVRAKKMRERLALLYVREPADMQLFGISDKMREESKEESVVQIQQLVTHIQEWVGKKPETVSYVREGDVSEVICDFIAKNRFVAGLVMTGWQLDNIAGGLYNYISGAYKNKQLRSVPVIVIPEETEVEQLKQV